MLRILHTADWHIGKNLHKVPMHDQFALFFDWLLEIIKSESIDVLLVSGDIFDYANPAADDRSLYYTFLKKLIDTQVKVIITGGNHDSAGFLNAPRDILNTLDITVIGEATENPDDELIEIYGSDGQIALVVAAVPFLKDKDLRNRDSDAKYENRTEAIRAGIKHHYSRLNEIISQKFKGIPSLAMGHLYAIGSDPSESERDIHMGNEAAIDSSVFKGFDYVALGHIHRPQIISKNEFIRYSGSPVPLSFSEKKDLKSVVIIDLVKDAFSIPRILPIPKTRSLIRITGTLHQVEEQLIKFSHDNVLPAFLEIKVNEAQHSSSAISALEELKQGYINDERFTIIKSKIEFDRGAKDISELFKESRSIEELKPAEVFKRKMEAEEIETEMQTVLQAAFLELLEKVMDED